MKRRVISLLLIVFFLVATRLHAQTVEGDKHTVSRTSLQSISGEKIFVHTDQAFYVSGDIIWFSVFVYDAVQLKPLSISSTAYIELVNEANERLLFTPVELNNGMGDGSWRLPSTIVSGTYLIRCYTSWLKESSPERVFTSSVMIVNPFENNVIDSRNAVPLTIEFYSGGPILSKTEKTIAYKVNGGVVDKTKYSLAIMDSEGRQCAGSNPDEFGVGTFKLVTEPNYRYRVIVKKDDAVVKDVELPEISVKGVSVKIIDHADSIYIKVQGSNVHDKLFLEVDEHGMIAYAAEGILGDTLQFSFVRTKLVGGVYSVKLYDVNHELLSETPFYGIPDQPAIEIIVNDSVKSRSEVRVKVKTPSELARISVSIYKKSTLNTLYKGSTINDYSSLISELDLPIPSRQNREWIQKFISYGSIKKKNGSDGVLIPEMKGQFVKGIVTNSQLLPISNKVFLLSAPGIAPDLAIARSNEQGLVRFSFNNLTGKHKLVLQSIEAIPFTFTLNSSYSETLNNIPRLPFFMREQMEQEITERSIGMQISNLFYSDELEVFKDEVDTIAFYGVPDRRYRLDDYTRFPSIAEIIREFISKVTIKDSSFVIVDQNKRRIFEGKPLVLVDGIIQHNHAKVLHLNPLTVKQVDVITRKHYYGSEEFNGILSFISYTGELAEFNVDANAVAFDYEFAQKRRLYYSPRYSTNDTGRMPDRRSLLYWNPNLIIHSSDGEEFIFYTSDMEGPFEIVVNGISTAGGVFSGEKLIHVTK